MRTRIVGGTWSEMLPNVHADVQMAVRSSTERMTVERRTNRKQADEEQQLRTVAGLLRRRSEGEADKESEEQK